MRKPLYIHIVTALAAASIAALPQSAFNRAFRAFTVALMVGAGGTAASKMAQWEQRRWRQGQVQEREEELRNRQAELTELQAQLQQTSQQAQDLKAQLVEQQHLQEELRLQEQRIEELSRKIQEREEELSRLREELQQLQDKDRRVQNLQAELKELQNKLFQREEEIKGLRAEQQRWLKTGVGSARQHNSHSRSCNPSETNITLKITEKEFYPQEAKSLILEILRKKIDSVHEGSRVQHILRNLVENNKAQEGDDHRRRISESIDKLFSSYNRWSDCYRRKLQQIDFEIIAENNHVKICFQGDRRYQISLPKTPSDRNAGRNISRDIHNTIFGL